MQKSNNKVTRFAITLLALTMAALILVSGTYAKYISSTTATSTARVAKWKIEVNEQDISNASSTPQTLTIDLWGTVKDTTNGNPAETDVVTKAQTTDDTIIAPGTQGEFELTIANKSEVNAKYSIALTSSIGSIPLEFSSDGGDAWKTSIAELNITDEPIAMGTESNPTESTPLTIQWRWAFTGAESSNYTSSQTDVTDTTLSVAGSARATVTATVTVEQVN